jgi:hypothetical protein
MPFVKVDCAIVDSSVWMPRDLRSLFLTALFMGRPYTLDEPSPQLKVRSNEPTGWTVPPGEYGLIEAAASRIIGRDGIELDAGLAALEILGEPDHESKDPDFNDRRLVRVSGGYLVLNYQKYRDKDYTIAERQRRFRERRKTSQKGDSNAVTTVTVTQAEAEAEAEGKIAVVADGTVEPTSPQSPAAAENSDSPEVGPALRLTIALNKGLRDNPAIGEHYNPVIATSGASLQAAEELTDAGVEIGFAATTIYALARSYVPKKLGDQINSLSYLRIKVVERWERERARIAAAAAPEPAGATNGTEPTSAANGNIGRRNGKRDLKGEGLIIYGRLRDSVREQIILNDANDPGAGNYRVHTVDPAEIQKLDAAGATALAAIGGARRLANTREDESIGWKFAAAYAAAAGAD